MKTNSLNLVLTRILALLSLGLLTGAYAANGTWNGTSSAVWSLAGNWSASPAPGTGETATFNNAGNANTTLDLGSGVTISSILFDTASVAAYTIGSGTVGSQTLTLNDSGSIMANSTIANAQTFNAKLTLGTDGTVQSYSIVNNSTTKLLTFANITGGTGGTAGAKTLNISTAAGKVTLNGPIVNGGASSLGLALTSISGNVGVNLSGGAANTYSGGTAVGSGVSVNVSTANSLSGGAITVASGGQIYLNSAGTYANNFTISGTGTDTRGALRMGNGAVNTINGTVTLAADASIGVDNSKSGVINGKVTGAFTLTKGLLGTGTLSLANSGNDYSGDTIISLGTLALTGGGVLPNTPNIILPSGAGFDVSTPTTALTLGAGQTLKASATGGNTTATITVASGKNLTLGGGLAFTALGSANTIAPLTVAGATAGSLDLNGKPVTVTTTALLPSATYTLVAASGSATVTGTPGTLTLNGVSSPSYANVAVSSGKLVLTISGTMPSLPSITTSGTLAAVNTTYGTASATPTSFTVSGANLAPASGNLTVTPPAGYEVSLSSGSGYTTSLSVPYSSPTLASTTVYVRLAAVTAAGTYSGNCVISGGGAVTASKATASSTVAKKALSVTAPTIASKVYDGTTTAGAVTVGTISGFVGSETVTATATAAAYSSANVGSYTGDTVTYTLVNGTGGGLAANYSLATETATGQITVKALSVSGVTAVNRPYNGLTSVTLGGSPVYVGLVTGDSFSVTGTASASVTTPDAGLAKPVTVTGYTTPSANYTVSQPTGVTVDISQASLSITANNDSKVYGQTKTYGAGSTNFTSSGLQNSDTIGTVTIIATSSPTNGTAATDNVDSYTLTPSGATGGSFNPANYSITYNDGALTVIQASTFVGASSTKNPSGYKDTVAYIATLPADAAGSVVFSSTIGAFSTNTVSSGSASSLSITNLPRGTNVITVAYLGDVNYVGSTNTLDQIVTNHPPVVNAASYTRNAVIQQLKIAVTNLLSNASDVDGDTLTLASVSATTNTATLVVSGGWVMYYNTNAVADEFTYTVSDGFGGTNSATVTLTLDSTPVFGQSTLASTTGGTATLNFAGIPTCSYSVLRSTNLTSWTAIWLTNAPASGVFQYIDNPAPQPSAYYRLQYNP